MFKTLAIVALAGMLAACGTATGRTITVAYLDTDGMVKTRPLQIGGGQWISDGIEASKECINCPGWD